VPPPATPSSWKRLKTSRQAVAAENYSEQKIVPTAKRPALEARPRYRMDGRIVDVSRGLHVRPNKKLKSSSAHSVIPVTDT